MQHFDSDFAQGFLAHLAEWNGADENPEAYPLSALVWALANDPGLEREFSRVVELARVEMRREMDPEQPTPETREATGEECDWLSEHWDDDDTCPVCTADWKQAGRTVSAGNTDTITCAACGLEMHADSLSGVLLSAVVPFDFDHEATQWERDDQLGKHDPGPMDPENAATTRAATAVDLLVLEARDHDLDAEQCICCGGDLTLVEDEAACECGFWAEFTADGSIDRAAVPVWWVSECGQCGHQLRWMRFGDGTLSYQCPDCGWCATPGTDACPGSPTTQKQQEQEDQTNG